MILHLEENKQGIDFVVGDLNGRFDDLSLMLNKLCFKEDKDRLICTGNLANETTEFQMLKQWLDCPWFYTVRGSGEDNIIKNGINLGVSGIDTDDRSDYKVAIACALSLMSLPLAIDVTVKGKKYGVIHSDCPFNNWEQLGYTNKTTVEDVYNCAIWSGCRSKSAYKGKIDNIEILYVGHTPQRTPILLGNVYNINTNFIYSGKLTIMRIGSYNSVA